MRQDCAVLYPESDPDVVSVGGTQLTLNTSTGAFKVNTPGQATRSPAPAPKTTAEPVADAATSSPRPATSRVLLAARAAAAFPMSRFNASPHPWTNYYFEGSLSGVAGTSLASPEMSGFIAQANAYLLSSVSQGVPLGEVN